MKTIFVKWGGVKTSKNLVKCGLSIVCMCLINSIKAQNTFTVSALKADSARIAYTKSDSISAGTVRTDTLCSAKDLCVHQDAKISGSVSVNGSLKLGSSMLFDSAPIEVAAKQSIYPNGSINFIVSAPQNLLGPIPGLNPCMMPPSAPGNYTVGAGFMSFNTLGSLAMYDAPWSGDGFIEVNGGNALLVNYFCGKDIYLGTGSGSPGSNIGGGGCKIYTGDYVQMRKKLQIGDPQWGIPSDPNNIALEVHANSGIGIRAKTWDIQIPMISVHNSNTNKYNGINVFEVKGDGRTTIITENVNAALTIKKWQTGMTAANSPTVFQVMADGKTYIGSKIIKNNNVHSDAILQVGGKIGAMELVLLDPLTKWNPWPDYVFEKNYPVLSINELEKYIQKERHLPEIPTAKEVAEQGINVNEMIPKLLKKIEEQTLYIIELNRKIEYLEKQIKK